MPFNVGKCKIMHFGSRNRQFQYTMGGKQLEETVMEKDIGILVHNSLKPSAQCSSAAQKANGVLGQLTRAVGYRL